MCVCVCCVITTENEETASNCAHSVPSRSFQKMSPSLEINLPGSLGKTLPQELLLMINPREVEFVASLGECKYCKTGFM